MRALGAWLVAVMLTACSTPPVDPSPAAIAALAPTGKLRAAINLGNPVLARADATTGEARGVTVDLSRELARRLGVPLLIVSVPTAAKSVAALKSGACDVAYVAIDPARAVDLDYTAPYVLIEGAYLVPQASPIQDNAEVDRQGVRVVVGAASAYDLYLSRELRQAQIVRVPTSAEVVSTMLAQHLEVAAGVRQQLQADAKRVAGVRLLDGRFMVISQALATAKQRAPGAAYVSAFIEEMKASGFIANALAQNGIDGAIVAPLAGQ
ncbi:MAG TPA: transporter substrate-binding domain-containing protein [Casimicrobiaceae bacterium]|nr:transporter substrate-binding domain-containing protein [Casimicrobiaceae bacterium]